jgi:hypothetical protein
MQLFYKLKLVGMKNLILLQKYNLKQQNYIHYLQIIHLKQEMLASHQTKHLPSKKKKKKGIDKIELD